MAAEGRQTLRVKVGGSEETVNVQVAVHETMDEVARQVRRHLHGVRALGSPMLLVTIALQQQAYTGAANTNRAMAHMCSNTDLQSMAHMCSKRRGTLCCNPQSSEYGNMGANHLLAVGHRCGRHRTGMRSSTCGSSVQDRSCSWMTVRLRPLAVCCTASRAKAQHTSSLLQKLAMVRRVCRGQL